MATKVSLNMDDLTLGDLEDFEKITGLDLMQALTPKPVLDPATGKTVPDPDPAKKGRPLMAAQIPTKALTGMIFLSIRADNPDITYDEVKRMRDIDFEVVETVDDADPLPDPVSESGSSA
jgi:hypothetical protein